MDYEQNDEIDDAISGLRGAELVCETQNFNQRQCESIACCEWDSGQCWSAVGSNKCDNFEGLHGAELVCETNNFNRNECEQISCC